MQRLDGDQGLNELRDITPHCKEMSCMEDEGAGETISSRLETKTCFGEAERVVLPPGCAFAPRSGVRELQASRT